MTEQMTLTPRWVAGSDRPVQAALGVPRAVPVRPRADVLQRFHAKIVKTDGCSWWVGGVAGGNGYGQFALTHDAVIGAHRFALEVVLGRRLIAGEVAAHGCDEPLCVRVGDGHIELATPGANVAQMVMRGRRRGPWVLDTRGPGGRSRAIRDAVRAAVAEGTDIDAAVEAAKDAGDPHARQMRLPW